MTSKWCSSCQQIVKVSDIFGMLIVLIIVAVMMIKFDNGEDYDEEDNK